MRNKDEREIIVKLKIKSNIRGKEKVTVIFLFIWFQKWIGCLHYLVTLATL